jgi:flavin-dependent dehydrogenase
VIDVLVAGGGPAGLATAIRCSQAGLLVVVAEPRSFPVDKACGEGLMPGALPRLAALGVEVAGLAGHPLRGIRYLDAGHRADAPFRHGNGLGVRRVELHAALSARAAALGIEVLPARVASFTQDEEGVMAALRPTSVSTADAGTGLGDFGRPITARYLVAADGLHSPIRRSLGLDPPPAQHIRYGLRRHYRIAPWTDLVEVYWSEGCEAYVTPVGDDVVGVAVLGGSRAGLDSRLAAFPALLDRLREAAPASGVRGAGPLRQDVRCRVAGRVLMVGDAAGYLDALTGEGIGAALAQAEVLAACLAAGRPADYERSWRRVTRRGWVLTSGLLWSRHQRLLGPRIVPAAARLPWLFGAIVNQVAWA